MSTRSILKRSKSPRETKKKRVLINTENNTKLEIERNDSGKKEGLRRERLATENYNRVRSFEEKEFEKQKQKQIEKKRKSVGILAANAARNRLNTGTPEIEHESDSDDEDNVIVVKRSKTSKMLPTKPRTPSPRRNTSTRKDPISNFVGSIFKFFKGGRTTRKIRRK
jgi:hypothetical protein